MILLNYNKLIKHKYRVILIDNIFNHNLYEELIILYKVVYKEENVCVITEENIHNINLSNSTKFLIIDNVDTDKHLFNLNTIKENYPNIIIILLSPKTHSYTFEYSSSVIIYEKYNGGFIIKKRQKRSF